MTTELHKKYNKIDKKIQRISATIGAIVAIIGAATGICTWVSNQFQAVISEQIQDFQEEVRASDRAQDQAITRIELLNLIQNDPTNSVAIEKMARHYFHDLDGDLYMTQKVSVWCGHQKIDCSDIVH